jgi:hypothetical protein
VDCRQTGSYILVNTCQPVQFGGKSAEFRSCPKSRISAQKLFFLRKNSSFYARPFRDETGCGKGLILDEKPEKHTSGAEAHFDLIAIMA